MTIANELDRFTASSGVKRPLLARAARNVARIPQRVWRGAARLFDPVYQLERQAVRHVNSWLDDSRRDQLDGIRGTTSSRECRLLAYLARTAPAEGVIIEIGCLIGKSTAWLIEGACRRANPTPVVSIDPHLYDTWEEFQDTVRRFDLSQRGLEVHRDLSHCVARTWTRPISLLWVDGCHEYEADCQDIDDFVPHVLPGGWVVFDDAAGGHFPGAERAIAERMRPRSEFEHLGIVRHLAVFRRR
jgi:predicted O-methyltransferase YrrM